MINYATYLVRKEMLKQPLHFNIFFGVLGTMPARMMDICYMANSLPPNSTWSGGGGGKFQLSVNLSSILLGGNVRVGLEDNLYYDDEKKQLASNEMLVKRLVNFSKEIGRPIATVKETREILSLK
jgi:uncharacterized protein (DUF849 family)